MAARITLSSYDRENKATSMSILGDDLVTTGQVQALADAVDAIILGVGVRAVRSIETVVDAGEAGPSSEFYAQRGNKWLMRVQDNVTSQIYNHEFGTADQEQLPSPGSDFLDLTGGVGLSLKTAFEAAYESPDGNAGTLLSVQQVNRGQ